MKHSPLRQSFPTSTMVNQLLLENCSEINRFPFLGLKEFSVSPKKLSKKQFVWPFVRTAQLTFYSYSWLYKEGCGRKLTSQRFSK